MIRIGTVVKWSWGKGTAKGKVVETFSKKITKNISDTTITRNGEPNNKALHIKQEDGNEVLKLESEVERNK